MSPQGFECVVKTQGGRTWHGYEPLHVVGVLKACIMRVVYSAFGNVKLKAVSTRSQPPWRARHRVRIGTKQAASTCCPTRGTWSALCVRPGLRVSDRELDVCNSAIGEYDVGPSCRRSDIVQHSAARLARWRPATHGSRACSWRNICHMMVGVLYISMFMSYTDGTGHKHF